ncbi:MAG: hypothetical protein COB85_03660 [Bacteroidetes bacterium]|nr:MAG: hypothetical protein COB85_03660 [Bacteroidota bacterium]
MKPTNNRSISITKFSNIKFATVTAFLFGAVSFGYPQSPQALFSADSDTGCAPLTVQYTNNSSYASSYLWDFGNGATSTLENPVNVYFNPGTYTVSLTVTSNSGASDTYSAVDAVTVITLPEADFNAQNTTSCLSGNSITFINNSNNSSSWIWDFGDGNTSITENPVHSYSNSGSYIVTMIAQNDVGCNAVISKPSYISIFSGWDAEFTVDTNVSCNLNHLFSFNCYATGVTSWSWDFGDGFLSNLQNPQHSYNDPGVYTISLITLNANGCVDTLVKDDYISVGFGYQPVITANITTGCIPLSVNFNDTNSLSSTWLWDFGDGDTSSLRNPIHIYSDSGSFDLTVIITNINGCVNTLTLDEYVTALNPPIANFSYNIFSRCSPRHIKFINNSANATSWLWDFGDGTTSTAEEPSHTYYDTGSYTVVLTVFSANGCSDVNEWVNMTTLTKPVAGFGETDTSGCVPFLTSFVDSSMDGVSWLWLFGDGDTSVQQNPVHVYKNDGTYDVTLIVSNLGGCVDTLTKLELITTQPYTPFYIEPSAYTGCAPLNMSFEDHTPGAVNWVWDFGDGSPVGNQGEANHTYQNEGTYIVSLVVETTSGCSQHIPAYKTIIVSEGKSDFAYSWNFCTPLTVNFTDSSTNANSWNWNFGDGSSSALQNPTHAYAGFGRYVVILTVTNAIGCFYTTAKMVTVEPRPSLAGPVFIASDSLYPMNMDLFANSNGATSWLWNFGDSSATSTLENPSHYYAFQPYWNITLIVSNGSCTDTFMLEVIEVSPMPGVPVGVEEEGTEENEIISYPALGCIPFTVCFYNEFPNAVSYTWSFGDGDSSNIADPIHVFNSPGSYDISLTVSNIDGTYDTLEMNDFIIAGGPEAAFTATVFPVCDSIGAELVDSSLNVLQWDWSFGNGVISTDQNPTHVYPAINTSYTISLMVTDSIGCTDLATSSLYTGILEPVFSFENEICAGDTAHFTSTLSGGSSWMWDFGDSNYSTDSFPLHIYADSGTYYPELIYNDTNGCAHSYVMTNGIVVYKPIADFTLSGATTACDSINVVVGNNSTGAQSYVWNFGDGSTSVDEVPMHSYYLPGSYLVSLEASINGCTSSVMSPDTVKVNAGKSHFGFDQVNYCLPVTVNYTDSSDNAVAWLWNFGDDNPLVTNQNPTHVFDSLPANDVSLTILDVNGCQATSSLPNISVLTASFEIGDSIGCSPHNISFTDNSLGAVSWFWDFGDGNTSVDRHPTHTYQSSGFYNVILIVSSVDGCSDTIFYSSLIQINEPIADFFTSDTSQCAPALVSFTDQSQNVSSYLWDFGDGIGSTNSNPDHIYVMPGFYSITLMVSDSFGCTDSIVRSEHIKLFGPLASFSSTETEGCGELNVSFTDQSENVASWSWSFGDGGSSSLQNPQYLYDNAGAFSVSLSVTDTLGCLSSYVLPDSVLIYPNPTANFSIPRESACTPFACTLINNSQFADNYQWNFNDEASDSTENPVYLFNNAGSYQISLSSTNSFGCSDSIVRTIFVRQSPEAQFVSDTASGCWLLHVNFTSQSANLEDPTYDWSFSDNSNLTDQDTMQVHNNIHFPNPSMTYYTTGLSDVSLIVTNSNGCSDTVIKSNYINVFDTASPADPVIYTATVLSNTSIRVIWENIDEDYLTHYEVYRKDILSAYFISVGTFQKQSTLEFVDDGLNTLENSYCYKVQAVYECDIMTSVDELIEYCTINVTAYTSGDKIEVEWSQYTGCSVGSYEVYRQKGNSSLSVHLATLPPTSYNYTDSSIICPDIYSYRIKATDLCGRSYISMSDTSTASPAENVFATQKTNVMRTTVVNNSAVLTEWTAPKIMPGNVSKYILLRSTDNIDFFYLASIPVGIHQYVDNNVSVDEQNYYYKIDIVNTCQIESHPGAQGSSILLRSETINGRPLLQWTSYDNWDTEVDYYLIEKKNDQGTWEPVKKVSGKSTNTKLD